LQLGFQRRYDAAHMHTRHAVQEGKLGRLIFVHSHTRDPEPPPATLWAVSGGIFRDTCVHDFDALRWIVGEEIVELTAMSSVGPDTNFTSSGEPDIAAIAVRFANGVLGHIDAVRGVRYGYDVRTEIIGTEATVMGGFHRDTPVTEFRPDGVRHDHVFWFPQRFGQAYRDELRAWVENLAAGRPITPTGEDGRQALVLALAAEESAAQGGAAVKL
jgi:myo-inositol 2-dehydrogenase/D-chiro-inositol 1-dehydrogenase